MKKLLSIILFSICALSVNAQTTVGNGVSVFQNKSLVFAFNNAEDLLKTQVIDNAIELHMSPQNYGMNTFAHVIFYNSDAKAYFANKLVMKLAHTTSTNAVVSNNEIMIGSTPVLLFRQPRNTSPVPITHVFTYDLILRPFDTFIKPDPYQFQIMITITPE